MNTQKLVLPQPSASLLRLLAAAMLAAALPAFAAEPPAPPAKPEDAHPSFSIDELRRITGVLSSDDFEGRAPGTRGEALTMQFLVAEFRKLGLEPGNPDGSYAQKVPLTGHISQPAAKPGKGLVWQTPRDYVAWTYLRQPQVEVKDSELVFVGYGIQAPEYGWNDFKGVDLKGKTLVMLINDPPIPDPKDPAKLDDKMFGGKAMTYYGRWTYKFESAAAQGAAGALIIHETEPAGYPYAVVVNSNNAEHFEITSTGANPHFPPVAGWLQEDAARALLQASGKDLAQLKAAALGRNFKPVALGTKVSFAVNNRWRDIESRNIVALLPGSDPKLAEELVIYTAHWDHLGWDPTLPGSKHDQIYHGALDNASGVAALVGLAKAFKALPVAPRRSVLFMATTAEEKGLLGAQYYAAHPLYPLARTVANINMDGINIVGRAKDVEVVGLGHSSLEDLLAAAAARQGRGLVAEAFPEKGFFFRSDHLEFARMGVPVLYAKSGLDFHEDREIRQRKVKDFVVRDYHKVSDVMTDAWDLSGAVEDLQLLFQVGYQAAQADDRPQWKPTSEFARRREALSGANAGTNLNANAKAPAKP